MAVIVKHKFVSPVPDSEDETIVQPSDWNEEHEVEGAIPDTGGTVTGPIISTHTGSPQSVGPAFGLDGPDGSIRNISFRTNGSTRWSFGAQQESETGGNVGSTFSLGAFGDNETYLGRVLTVYRDTRKVNFNFMPEVAGRSIVERGSNGNGEYVRFADGTQICTKIVGLGQLTFSYSGTSYIADQAVGAGSWAASFASMPAVSALYQGAGYAWPSMANNTSNSSHGGVSLWRSTAATLSSGSVGLMAVGRWY